MLGGHGADAHHGGDHGDIVFFRKGAHHPSALAQMHTAAGAQNWATAGRKGLHQLFQLRRVALIGGLVGAQIHFLGPHELFHFGQLHIHGHIHQHRAGAAAGCNVKGLAQNTGNIPRLAHQIAVLYKAFRSAGDIGLLKHIAAHQSAVHLAGNAHQRNAVGIGRGNAGDQVGGARAAGADGHAHLAVQARKAAGHVRRVGLDAYQHRMNIGFEQAVEYRANGYAGVAENRFYALHLQRLCNGLCAVHGAFSPLCVMVVCFG